MTRVVLLVWFVVLAVAAAAAAAQPAPPPLRVKVKQCATGESPADRSAVFEASMPREDGAGSMAMRFKLYESVDGTAFKRVTPPGFGGWVRSAPNVAGLVFDKHVNQLAAGTAYRVVVDFVWNDAGGKPVDKARRRSGTCREPARAA